MMRMWQLPRKESGGILCMYGEASLQVVPSVLKPWRCASSKLLRRNQQHLLILLLRQLVIAAVEVVVGGRDASHPSSCRIGN